MNNVFIISKPLQYLNAANISTRGPRFLLIVDDFFNAKEVYLALKEKSIYWNKISFFDVWTDAYDWILKNKLDIDNLYIDSDHGWTKYSYLKQFDKINIYVYEEGIGNYRKTLNEKNLFGKFKKIIYEYLLGNKVYLGGSKYTKGIYLYDKERFNENVLSNKKELLSFSTSFHNHLETFKDREVFLDQSTINLIKKLHNKKVLFYLTSWSYDKKMDELITDYDDYFKILKLHPHIKEIGTYSKEYDFIMEGDNLIELVIIELLKTCEKVVIFHHGTSAIMYFNNESKLETVKI